MMAAGKSADEAAIETVNKGGYIVIYEGSVMQGFDGNSLFFGGGPNNEGAKTGIAWLEEAAKGADAVIAVGSCAVDGGWVAANPNPADATGVLPYLKSKGIDTPVINLPTCPVNPEWIVAMVVDVLMLGKLPEMDEFNRPKLIFGQTIHDNCPRRGHFENGEFVYEFGSEEEKKDYCLYAVGCKGPADVHQLPDRPLECQAELVRRVRLAVHRLRQRQSDQGWRQLGRRRRPVPEPLPRPSARRQRRQRAAGHACARSPAAWSRQASSSTESAWPPPAGPRAGPRTRR